MVKIATQCIHFFLCVSMLQNLLYPYGDFHPLRGEIYNSIQHKLQNSMEVDSVGIIAILSMSYITTRIVKTQTSVEKIPRVPVENQITTINVVKIALKFSPCTLIIFYCSSYTADYLMPSTFQLYAQPSISLVISLVLVCFSLYLTHNFIHCLLSHFPHGLGYGIINYLNHIILHTLSKTKVSTCAFVLIESGEKKNVK